MSIDRKRGLVSTIKSVIKSQPSFYLVYTENITPRAQRTLNMGQAVSPSLLKSKLFLDVVLINQKSVDPNFTSIKNSLFEMVSGFNDGHSHCFTGEGQFTCCRVFDASGYRCQSIGYPYTLTELDKKSRVRPEDNTTIFTYVHAEERQEANNAMQIVRTDAVLGTEPFNRDSTIFYLCAEHHDMFEIYFDEANLEYQETSITTPSISNISYNTIAAGLYTSAIEMLSNMAFSLKDFVSAISDPKTMAETIISYIPSDEILRFIPISNDYIISPFNRWYNTLSHALKTNQSLFQFYNFINGIRPVDGIIIGNRIVPRRPIVDDIISQLKSPITHPSLLYPPTRAKESLSLSSSTSSGSSSLDKLGRLSPGNSSPRYSSSSGRSSSSSPGNSSPSYSSSSGSSDRSSPGNSSPSYSSRSGSSTPSYSSNSGSSSPSYSSNSGSSSPSYSSNSGSSSPSYSSNSDSSDLFDRITNKISNLIDVEWENSDDEKDDLSDGVNTPPYIGSTPATESGGVRSSTPFYLEDFI